jgi:hypothetical protein
LACDCRENNSHSVQFPSTKKFSGLRRGWSSFLEPVGRKMYATS